MEPVVPERKVRHLFYMIGGYMTVVAALANPRITLILSLTALGVGLFWWFYPLARAKFTKPIEVVEEKPIRTPNRPKVHDQRESGQIVSLSDDETKRLGIDPDITHLIPKIGREEAS